MSVNILMSVCVASITYSLVVRDMSCKVCDNILSNLRDELKVMKSF